MNRNACRLPFEATTRSAGTPWRSPIHARSPGWPAPPRYASASAGSRVSAVSTAARRSSTGSRSALGTPRVKGIWAIGAPYKEPCALDSQASGVCYESTGDATLGPHGRAGLRPNRAPRAVLEAGGPLRGDRPRPGRGARRPPSPRASPRAGAPRKHRGDLRRSRRDVSAGHARRLRAARARTSCRRSSRRACC